MLKFDKLLKVILFHSTVIFVFHNKYVMKKYLIGLLFLGALSLNAMKQDSIGMKNINGKNFVMHKVIKGEGVYSLAKKYSVTAADIYAANEGTDKGIKIDQVLLIPRLKGYGSSGAGTVSGSGSFTATAITKIEKVYHTVVSGQTLSAIAKKYTITIAQIKTWNNLKSDNINLGQKLIVGEKKIVVSKPAKKIVEEPIVEETVVEEPVPQEIKKLEPIKVDNKITITTSIETPAPGDVIIDTKKIEAKVKTEPTPVVNSYKVDDGDELTEKGLASISSEGELSQERSFILHPTAKIGTIMMITNPVNDNAVFVRVVGSCKASEGVILKMSKAVAAKLGLNSNAEVTISYAK